MNIHKPARSVDEIIIHCTATRPDFMAGKGSAARVAEIKRWHVDERKWSNIGYHYLIDRNGSVLEGRDVETIGAHTKGHNTGSIGVALFGGHGSSSSDNFSDNYTPEQEAALFELVGQFSSMFPGLKISGHNAYAAKACPGFNVQQWLNRFDVQPPQSAGIPDEVKELIEETSAEGSKTDLFNQFTQWAMGGGAAALLANFKDLSQSLDWRVLVALIASAGLVLAVATYTRSSRKRKGEKAMKAGFALRALL